MKQTILSIARKPGLYKLVSRGKNNLIVETLEETHRRMPVFNSDRVTSLADIAMYTEEDDVPLMNVMVSIRDKEESKPCSISFKKATSVHDSDIRKLLQWYDLLVKNGITDFEDDLEPTEGDNIDDRKDQ